MTANAETNPCREQEVTESIREAWADGFAAGRRAAFDETLLLTAQARLSEEERRGSANPPPAATTFPYTIPSLQGFYHVGPDQSVCERRFLSGEADYGVGWKLKGWPGTWRVSYIQGTGEVYAVNNHVIKNDCRVMVLGVVPADTQERGEIYYHTLDRILDGWTDHCHVDNPNGLSWVIARLREWAEEVGHDC